MLTILFLLFPNLFATQSSITNSEIREDFSSSATVIASPVSMKKLIPNYDDIYAAIPDVKEGEVNNVTVAGINKMLSYHGRYEFVPETYPALTDNTKKYGFPVDISFSRQTKRASVLWKRKGIRRLFYGKYKTKKFETREITSLNSFLDSEIPNYNAIYHKGHNLEKGSVNNIMIAAINAMLAQYGKYELPINTYLSITKSTQEYGVPLDVAFSHETRCISIQWGRSKSCCYSDSYTKMFKVFPALEVLPAKRLLTNQDQRNARYAELGRTPVPSNMQKVFTQERLEPNLHHQSMTRETASTLLLKEFNRLNSSLRIGGSYLTRDQSNEIIRLLVKKGPAQFSIEEDAKKFLFFTVKWANQQKAYPMYKTL